MFLKFLKWNRRIWIACGCKPTLWEKASCSKQ